MTNPTKKRGLMAPETKPTYAELQIVMQEALDLAMAYLDASAIAGNRRSGS